MVLGEQMFLFMSAEKATLAGAVVLIATGVWVMFQEVKGKAVEGQEAPSSPESGLGPPRPLGGAWWPSWVSHVWLTRIFRATST
jgi:hypothetical protein